MEQLSVERKQFLEVRTEQYATICCSVTYYDHDYDVLAIPLWNHAGTSSEKMLKMERERDAKR